MAANDPSFDVATPRGVLQGVAVFNWDGSQWQPTGRAATEVATPTGVLRGVAAFSGGPNWSPAARAQTEVPTPSGVLDGVAVYTWDGTKWVPPTGNIETATPSGVLEGVAAFDWDGTNWQPQAQAGAEVPTPYGVLTGVARFGWTGSAWAAVGAPSLSLDFMTPGQLDSRITFSRASTATFTGSDGLVQTAAVNAPRWDYANGVLRGLLIEEARTNILLLSEDFSAWIPESANGPAPPITTVDQVTAPNGTLTADMLVFPAISGANAVSQTRRGITTVAAVYTYSVYLRGSVGGEQIYLFYRAAGYNTPLRITLTTQWQRFSLVTTTLTVGTTNFYIGTDLRDTVNQVATPACTIYAWGAQVEQGAFPTSYIPTASVAVLRAADLAAIPATPGASGTYAARFIPTGAAASLPIVISGNAGSPVMSIGADSRLVASIKGGASVFSGVAPALTFSAVNKVAFAWLTGASKAAVNGTLLGANAVALTVSGTSLQLGSDGVTPGSNAISGALQSVLGWPRVLSDAEMTQVTT